MPRRVAPRCPVRGTTAEKLDALVEMNLTTGEAFGHWDLRALAEFARPWATFGDEITRRWRAAFPGSRPFAMYVLGEIPPPTWRHDWLGLRRPLRRIEGCGVVIPDCGFHMGEAEFEHLVALGLIDRDEREEALDRLSEPGWSYYSRYDQIGRD